MDFVTDDQIVSEEDVFRYRVLSGVEILRLQSRARWGGFVCGFLLTVLVILVIWGLRFVFYP